MRKFAAFDIDHTITKDFAFGVEFVHMLSATLFPSEHQIIDKAYREWTMANHEDRPVIFDKYLRPYFRQKMPGLTREQLEDIGRRVAVKALNYLNTWTTDRIALRKSEGYFLIALTFSPKIAVQSFAEHFGFDELWAPGMIFDDHGIMISSEHYDAQLWDKGNRLSELIKSYDLNINDSDAYGDSKHDIPMLEIAQNSFAVNPEPLLYEAAIQNGWEIIR